MTPATKTKVQRIPSQKMPKVAQVRYFNDADSALADRCVDVLAYCERFIPMRGCTDRITFAERAT
jgi:hypothetical protein